MLVGHLTHIYANFLSQTYVAEAHYLNAHIDVILASKLMIFQIFIGQ